MTAFGKTRLPTLTISIFIDCFSIVQNGRKVFSDSAHMWQKSRLWSHRTECRASYQSLFFSFLNSRVFPYDVIFVCLGGVYIALTVLCVAVFQLSSDTWLIMQLFWLNLPSILFIRMYFDLHCFQYQGFCPSKVLHRHNSILMAQKAFYI